MQAGGQGAFSHIFVKFPVLQMSGNFVSIGNSKSEHFFNLGTDTKITKKFQNAQIWKVQGMKVHWPLISMIK